MTTSSPTVRRSRIGAVVGLSLVASMTIGLGACDRDRAPAPAPATPPAPVDRSDARVRMALTLLDEGQIESAIEQLQRLPADPQNTITPTHTPAWFDAVIERLLRRRAVAASSSLLALTGPVGDRSALLRLYTANLQVMQGESDAAVATYASIRTDDVDVQLRALHELATLHFARGEYGEAFARAQEGVALRPHYAPLHVLAAQARWRDGHPDDALRELRKMDPSPARWMAEAELQLDAFDRPDSAVVLLSRAAEAVPQDPVLRQMLGRAWLAAGHPRNATSLLGPLASLPVPFDRSQSLLAEAYQALGRTAASDSLRALVEARQRSERVLELRQEGIRSSLAGDAATALARFDAALRLVPDDGDLHNDRGAALAKLERWAEAERAFRRAAELRPDDPTPLENLARLYQRTGDVAARDEALAAAQRLRGSPSAPDAPPR